MIVNWTWLVWGELVFLCYVAGAMIPPGWPACRRLAQVLDRPDDPLGRLGFVYMTGPRADLRMAPLLGPPIPPPNRGRGFDPPAPWLSGR